MFVDGVGSDVEGEEFNLDGCQWEAEEVDDDDMEEKPAAAAAAPPSSAIPEKVYFLLKSARESI